MTALEQPAERRDIVETLRVYHETTVSLVLGELALEEAREIVRAAVADELELAALWAQVEAGTAPSGIFGMKLFEKYFTPSPKVATAQRPKGNGGK